MPPADWPGGGPRRDSSASVVDRRNVSKNLGAIASSLSIGDAALWSWICDNMTAVYTAFFLQVPSSTGEGPANAVGEATVYGITLAATRVGDAPALVEAAGIAVDPVDDKVMALAVSSLRREFALALATWVARLWIRMALSVEALGRNTRHLLLSLLPQACTAPTLGEA